MITNPSFTWMEGHTMNVWIKDPKYNSEVLQFGDNDFWIREKMHSDRGNYKCILDASSLPGFSGYTRYYFDLNNLEIEILSMLTAKKHNLSADGFYIKHCIVKFITTQCNVYIFESQNPMLYGEYVAHVESHMDCDSNFQAKFSGGTMPVSGNNQDYLVVDAADCFPRFYYSKTVAIEEMSHWVIARKQNILRIISRPFS